MHVCAFEPGCCRVPLLCARGSLGAGAAAGCRSCVRLGPLLCAGAVAAGAAGKVFLLSGVYAGVT